MAVDKTAITYINYHLKNRDFKSDIIFNNIRNTHSSGRRLSIVGANLALAKVLKKAGINRKLSTHTFRHTCAVNILRNKNINKEIIQAQFGWASDAAVDFYMKRDRIMLRDFALKDSILNEIPISKKQKEMEKMLESFF